MFQAFPSFVLAIAIAAILGQGMANMVIAVVAVKWTEFARLSRSLAISVKKLELRERRARVRRGSCGNWHEISIAEHGSAAVRDGRAFGWRCRAYHGRSVVFGSWAGPSHQ